jgi:hypothetical protein
MSIPKIARDVFALKVGVVSLEWPSDLIDADDIKEIEAWLALIVRKMKRRAVKPA